MTRGAKAGLILLGLAGAGVGSYFIFRKSKETLKNEILGFASDPYEAEQLKPELEKMTRQELVSVSEMFYCLRFNITPTEELRRKISAISYKYNIFT